MDSGGWYGAMFNSSVIRHPSDGLLLLLEQLYRPSILFKLITSSLVNTAKVRNCSPNAIASEIYN